MTNTLEPVLERLELRIREAIQKRNAKRGEPPELSQADLKDLAETLGVVSALHADFPMEFAAINGDVLAATMCVEALNNYRVVVGKFLDCVNFDSLDPEKNRAHKALVLLRSMASDIELTIRAFEGAHVFDQPQEAQPNA